MRKNQGFTLIELILVIAILGLLVSTLVYLINPRQQLAKARDAQRETDIISILSIISQYSAEHGGALPDTDGDPETSNFPTSLTCIGTNPGCFDLGSAGEDGDTIIPVYTSYIPEDPLEGGSGNTNYLIFVDENKRLTASASGETKEITVTR